MAKKVSKSGLAAKLGAKGKKAFDSHKSDDVDFGGGGDLPEGIEGGIAQLTECKFSTYAKGDNIGECFFYAGGTVIEPTVHANVRTQGLHTSIMEPLHDTPNRSRKTVDDHVCWVLNELKKLGVETDDASFDDFEELAAAIKEEAPYFRFRTWKGEATDQYPNPRVNEQWKGACEYEAEEDEEDDGVVDAGGEVEEDNEPEEVVNEEAEASLSALGEEADGDEVEAQTKLQDLAEASGIDPEAYSTWGELATALEEGGNEEESTEEEILPEKDDVYYYRPLKARKSVEVVVTAVFVKKKTCNLKNLDDDTSYKSVSWSKLTT